MRNKRKQQRPILPREKRECGLCPKTRLKTQKKSMIRVKGGRLY